MKENEEIDPADKVIAQLKNFCVEFISRDFYDELILEQFSSELQTFEAIKKFGLAELCKKIDNYFKPAYVQKKEWHLEHSTVIIELDKIFA